MQPSDDGVGQNGVPSEVRNHRHGASLLERIDEGTLAEQQHDHVVSSNQVETRLRLTIGAPVLLAS